MPETQFKVFKRLTAAALFGAMCGVPVAAQEDKPNILIIMGDDIGITEVARFV